MATQPDQIADALTREILTGRYQPGDRIPSERELAQRFDANRGSVREAMKIVQQLGLADVQPGGARVSPVEEASLDVIGHLLSLPNSPDAALVEQIMAVLGALTGLAARTAARDASDAELTRIIEAIDALIAIDADDPGYVEARFALLGSIMEISGNLACRLIARSLLIQFVPRMAALESHVEPSQPEAVPKLKTLRAGIAARDVDAVGAVMDELSTLNQTTVLAALARVSQPTEAILP